MEKIIIYANGFTVEIDTLLNSGVGMVFLIKDGESIGALNIKTHRLKFKERINGAKGYKVYHVLKKDNVEIIELNEVEQKNLFCAAWHLTNLIEDAKEKLTANLATPCNTCKYQKECYEKDNFDMYSHLGTLGKLTGVKFLAWLGARNKGISNLLEGEIEK
ncbi:hypothetical protein [Candidatus Clostridium helianthi]|uniref:Uncharacterized protein n=1 Tax=Candidatus Clostridium helianthi TaxID=3381660 RepID=A0ABW8S6A6_9CLOT